VKDTGTGIAPEIQDRIFEPFFTTKEEGYGSGMGLATVYGIVANHGGWIELDSRPGAGTTFTICIPVPPESGTGADAGHEDEKPVSGGSSTIMLVDDELVIINTVEAMLRNLGYSVVTASDGQTAVEMYREHPGGIDLIIMDLAMPGMDGTECFRRLREVNPEVKVILSSGYGREGRAQEILDAGALAFLRKPYSLSDLSSLLCDILG
jgi:two-component system cell cycle sensor histidine kinase/response regulator CckA